MTPHEPPRPPRPPGPPPPPLPPGASRGRFTRLTPYEASVFLAQALASNGAALATRTDTVISGSVRVQRRPSCLLACLLALFFIVPAVIYLAVAGKDATYVFNILLTPQEGGCLLTAIGQGRGLQVALESIEALPP